MVISVGQSTVAAISGLHCRALVIVSSSIRLTAWLQNSKKRAGTDPQKIDVWAESTAIISIWLSASSSALSWAVNHYRDSAVHYKAGKQKVWKRTEAQPEQLDTDHADASAWCCTLDAKYTKELADAKAENDALRDDVAAGRRRLHIKAVCRSVREAAATSGVDNAASRLADYPLNRIISPSRGWSLCKNNWKEPRVY